MAITESDIKLLQSARMTDTADGGGRMTGNVVQSGVDNNLFDDVSNLDRVYGNVSLRKVFAGVLTNTTDKYLGSRVIIDEAPADPYVDATLFAASSVFDTRSEAKSRVEAYLALGAPYIGLLYGPHITGMAVLAILQDPDSAIPAVGEVLVLKKDIGLPTETEQFLRLTSVTSTAVSFTDQQGPFTRTLVTCGLSDPLRTDFPGWEASRTDSGLDYTGKSRLFESVVANAAQYYGIKPLAAAASIGAYNIVAQSAYSQLLPSAQVESPITDAGATGYATASTATQSGGVTYRVAGAMLTTTQSLYVGAGVARGTLSILPSAWSTPLTDDGAGALLYGSAEVGSVDYTNGLVALSDATYAIQGVSTDITYTPSILPSMALRSFHTEVTLESRSMSYALTLNGKVSAGTLQVHYMASGRWYVLTDDGAGRLRGAASGVGAGSVNFSSGSVTVTLGALPDVGSDIIYMWGEETSAVALSATNALVANPRLGFVVPLSGLRTDQDIAIAWNDGTARSITVSGNASTGHGTVDATGSAITVMPQTLPAPGTVFTVNYKAMVTQSVAVASVLSGSCGVAIHPGSFSMQVSFEFAFGLTGSFGGTTNIYLDTSVFMGVSAFVSAQKQVTLVRQAEVRDDGAGNLQINVFNSLGERTWLVVGTVNYNTGAYAVSASLVPAAVFPGPQIIVMPPDSGYSYRVGWSSMPSAGKSLTVSGLNATGTAYFRSGTGTAASTTATPSSYFCKVLTPPSGGQTLRDVAFTLATGANTRRYLQDKVTPSKLVVDPNPLTGVGTQVGTVDAATGVISLTTWTAGVSSSVTSFAGGLLSPMDAASEGNRYLSETMVFRTQTAPLRPGGFSVQGAFANGNTFNLTAGPTGKIESAQVVGYVNYATGVCVLHAVEPDTNAHSVPYNLPPNLSTIFGYPSVAITVSGGFRTSTVRYNAVAYTYVPLDADVLGLDPVRLPSDGRVPIYKAGRVVVVHNTQRLPAQTVSNNQTVNCGRQLLARIRVFGNDGVEITSGFTRNLDAGTATFTNVAGMSQPVVIEHRIEDEALCADAQITGDLRLTRPLTHNYPAGTSHVSSAYVVGTLQAAAQDAFSQNTWTDVWSDVRIGNAILAQFNDTDHPIAVTNAGAVSERWALIFKSNSTFDVVGEALGLILQGTTAATLAPVNPATGVPYFTLQPAGWGSGWAAGNVVRFNTKGANFPLWVARTVRQSPSAAPGTDQMTISIRGDIDQ